jgi:hypothetical protein
VFLFIVNHRLILLGLLLAVHQLLFLLVQISLENVILQIKLDDIVRVLLVSCPQEELAVTDAADFSTFNGLADLLHRHCTAVNDSALSSERSHLEQTLLAGAMSTELAACLVFLLQFLIAGDALEVS